MPWILFFFLFLETPFSAFEWKCGVCLPMCNWHHPQRHISQETGSKTISKYDASFKISYNNCFPVSTSAKKFSPLVFKQLNGDKKKPLPDVAWSQIYWNALLNSTEVNKFYTKPKGSGWSLSSLEIVIQNLKRSVDYALFSHQNIKLFKNITFLLNIFTRHDKIAPLLTQTHVGQPPAKISTLHGGIEADFRWSLHPLLFPLFHSKSSHFPASHWQWRGRVHTRCSLTPERQRWGVPIVCSFFLLLLKETSCKMSSALCTVECFSRTTIHNHRITD